MRLLKYVKLHHIVVILFILFVASYIVVPKIISQNRKNLFEKGVSTICRVYRMQVAGRSGTAHYGHYYYYYKGKKYFDDYILMDNSIVPTNKYFKVFFMPEKPSMSVVDYSKEIIPDSVFKYFPTGKNPFAEQIKQGNLEKVNSDMSRNEREKKLFKDAMKKTKIDSSLSR